MIQEVIASLQSAEATDAGVRGRFCFAADLRVFEGHFPGYPLVPAVFQLAAVRVAVERVRQQTLRIAEVVDSKFKAELRPDQALDVEVLVTELDDALDCKATLQAPHGLVAKLRLRLVAVC